MQVGADDYIPKPFSMEVLIAKILNMLRTRYRIFEHFSNTAEIEPDKITSNAMDEEMLKKAIAIVEKNISNVEFSTEQFASEMNMSRSNLHLKLKAITGKSAIDFIHKIRFNRACQLLKEGKYTVSEISFMVGYNTPSYFAARFKNIWGVFLQNTERNNKDTILLYFIMMKIYTLYVVFSMFVSFLLMSCSQERKSDFLIVKKDSLQYEGKSVELFKITNKQGMAIEVTNYGASLVFVSAPDKNGVFEPVVLGLDSLRHYLGRQPKLGATVGRFANRIKDAEFSLGKTVYHLDKNSKAHSIHGGVKGFNLQVFDVDTSYIVKDTAVVVFKYLSPDLEGGFPGNLNLSLAYKLTNDNEVILDYEASTDKPTIVNLTNHSYFNLAGCKESVLNHYYMIAGDSITPVDSMGIPTGELMAVAGTEYDFRVLQSAKQRIEKGKRGMTSIINSINSREL